MPVMTKKTWVQFTHADGIKGAFTKRDKVVGTSRIVKVDNALDAYDAALQDYIKTEATQRPGKKQQLSKKLDDVVDAFLAYIQAKHDDKGNKIAAGEGLSSLSAGGNSGLELKKRNHQMSVDYKDEACAGGKKNFDLDEYIKNMDAAATVPQKVNPQIATFSARVSTFFKSVRIDGDGDHVFQRLAKEVAVELDLMKPGGWYDTDGGTAEKTARNARLTLLKNTFTSGAQFIPKSTYKASLTNQTTPPVNMAGRVEDEAARIFGLKGLERVYDQRVSDGSRQEIKSFKGIMWEVVCGCIEFAKGMCELFKDEFFKDLCGSIVSDCCAEFLGELGPYVGTAVSGFRFVSKVREAIAQAKNERTAKSSLRYVSGELTAAWKACTDMFNEAKKDAIGEAVGAGVGALSSIAEWVFPGLGTVIAKGVNALVKIGLCIKQIYYAHKNLGKIRDANDAINKIAHHPQNGQPITAETYTDIFETLPLAGAYVIYQAEPIALVASYAYIQAPGGIDIGPYFKSIWQPMRRVKDSAQELILASPFVLHPGIEKVPEPDPTAKGTLAKIGSVINKLGDSMDRGTALLGVG